MYTIDASNFSSSYQHVLALAITYPVSHYTLSVKIIPSIVHIYCTKLLKLLCMLAVHGGFKSSLVLM